MNQMLADQGAPMPPRSTGVVRDHGSRQGTRVDDLPIGSGALRDILTVSIGTHEVVAGPADSPFRFKVVVRPDGSVLQ